MIAFILLIIASASKATMDTLVHHFDSSVFNGINNDFYNPSVSWMNKYKDDWCTPRFFGSTTFLVWTTDAWHLAQVIFLLTFSLSFYLTSDLLVYVVNITLFMVMFEIIYLAMSYKLVDSIYRIINKLKGKK